MFNQHCVFLFQTPLSEAGSLSEGAAAFDVIAAGGPLSVDTGGDLGELHLVPVTCSGFDFWLLHSVIAIKMRLAPVGTFYIQ